MRYLVLRNHSGLPENPGNDIDILVSPDHEPELLDVLEETSRDHGWQPAIRVKRYAYKAVLLYNRSTGESLLFDIYTELHHRGITFANRETILNRPQIHNGIKAASEGSSAAVTVLKELLMNGAVKKPPDTLENLRRSVADGQEAFTEAIGERLSPECICLLTEKILHGKWDDLAGARRAVIRGLLIRGLARNPVWLALGWWWFAVGHLGQMFRRSGLFLVFLGPDGSGKTWAMNAVSSEFHPSIFKRQKLLQKDFGILPHLKFLKRLFSQGHTDGDIGEDRRSDELAGMVDPLAPGRATLYLVYYFMDALLGHITVFFMRWRENLILSDRYFYDYFYQRAYRRLPERAVRILSRFVPRPDHVFVMHGSPAIIGERKPELTTEEIRQQIDALMQLRERDRRWIEIDTTGPREDTRQKLLTSIWLGMIERTQTGHW